jgi:hypothetical protein
MLWFYLVISQGKHFAISNVAEGTLTTAYAICVGLEFHEINFTDVQREKKNSST